MFLHLHFFVSVEFAGNVADLAWQITFHIFKYSYIFSCDGNSLSYHVLSDGKLTCMLGLYWERRDS